jgi:hypothetical protein
MAAQVDGQPAVHVRPVRRSSERHDHRLGRPLRVLRRPKVDRRRRAGRGWSVLGSTQSRANDPVRPIFLLERSDAFGRVSLDLAMCRRRHYCLRPTNPAIAVPTASIGLDPAETSLP